MTIRKTKGPSVTDGSQHVADGRWDIPRYTVVPTIASVPAGTLLVDSNDGTLQLVLATVNPGDAVVAASRVIAGTTDVRTLFPEDEITFAVATDGSDGEITTIYLLPVADGGSEEATLAYDGQTGNFTIGSTLTGTTSGHTAVIRADADAGATGTLTLSAPTGIFQNNEDITDAATGAAVANGTATFTGRVYASTVKNRNGSATVGTVAKSDATEAEILAATNMVVIDFSSADKVRDVVIRMGPTFDSGTQAYITVEGRSYA
jgi:hypothetical protein